MKFNNKGMTLIELLVTLVFVGIILVFMFTMLNELRNETNNNNFAYNNQVNKVDAIHAIQKDLNTYSLLGIQDNSNDNGIILNFYYLKGDVKKTAIMEAPKTNGKYYINYINVDGEENKWEMKDAEIDTCAKFTIYNEGSNKTDSNKLNGDNYRSNNYYFKININLYNKNYHEQNNKDKNNYVDDIEITYAGVNDYLENNSNYLTSKNNGTYNIGKCTN